MTVAADLLRGRTWVALTGAGISTDSGIPDYRGPDLGPGDADAVQRVRRIGRGPAALLGEVLPGLAADRSSRAERRAPGAGRARGRTGCQGVITQNVDGLHQAAGSRTVVNLHGDIARVVCLDCERLSPRSEMQRRLAELNPRRRAAGAPRARRAASRRRRSGRAVARLRPGRLPGLRRPAQAGRGVLRGVGAEGSGRAGVRAGRGGRGAGRARVVAHRDVGPAVRPAPGQVRATGGDHQPRRRPGATSWPRSRSTAAARRP